MQNNTLGDVHDNDIDVEFRVSGSSLCIHQHQWESKEYDESSEEEAKAACESHRRRILEAEAELEPVYQSTERPTKPGWYWFRESEDLSWVCVNVYEAKEEPDLIVENGMDDPNHLGNCPGEYVGPIPEPETKGDMK